MDPNERENSSNYVNEPREEAPAEERPVQQVEPEQKPRKGKGKVMLVFLLLLAVLLAAALGWLWYQQNGRVNDLEADLSVARNDVARLESAAKAESKLSNGSDIATETADTESEAVVKAALAYMEAPVRPLGDTREARVEYLKNGFAKVIVSSTTAETNSGGTSVAKIAFALTLKESNDDWIVLSAAEGPVADMDELMKEYGIPREAF